MRTPESNSSVVADSALRRPQLLRVNERIYSAVGYAISNVLYVLTRTSVVVIDTTESMSAARASLDEFRLISSLPVSHIIYTHFHGDHIRGARVFHEPSTRVIAQRRLSEELAYVAQMLPYRKRATALQFGFKLKPEQRGVALVGERENGYIAPDILFDEEYRFREGDLSFELYHTQGETVDHLMVWIPEMRALFPGDLYYSGFPMLSTPMRTDRPVLAWAESVERMRALHPEHLVPSHSRPVSGVDEIDSVLANYSRAIRYVHDETVNGINAGLPLEQIRNNVKLPSDLAVLPYLQERYGKVAWSVNGIFRQNTGWYSFDPTDLNPGPRKHLREALVDAVGDPAPIVTRARQALLEGQNQLALELADIVLGARPRQPGAKNIRLRALRRLGAASRNGVEQNIYRTAAKEALSALDPPQMQPHACERLNYSGIWKRSEIKPVAQAETNKIYVTKSRSLQTRTAALVNRWYDQRMFADWAGKSYAWSDFHNFGYWTDQTRTQLDACKNLMEVLLAFFPVRSGKILDVGCGKGATTRYLLKYYNPANVTGINISEKQLQRCRLNAPGCRFVRMNATNMSFEDAAFDHIISVEAAHHFADRQNFLRGAYRILGPGGRLVLSDLVSSAGSVGGGPLCPRQEFMSPMEYRDLYLRAGFEQLEIIDASRECIFGLRRHVLRSLRERAENGEIDSVAFRARRDQILKKNENTGYYLLVCAQKAKTE
jgi:glyoxylase-like metal-dependent hydrolase (beta-lactamase superfamily II)/cyclopropane fatty-acyl-phospholipid synthase-like methyltransferase